MLEGEFEQFDFGIEEAKETKERKLF